MSTVTIPRKITGGEELVILPRREYEELLDITKIKKKRSKIDEDLEEALEDVEKDRLIGPFMSAKEGLQALKQAE